MSSLRYGPTAGSSPNVSASLGNWPLAPSLRGSSPCEPPCIGALFSVSVASSLLWIMPAIPSCRGGAALKDRPYETPKEDRSGS